MIQTVTIDIPTSWWLTSNQRMHWAEKARRALSGWCSTNQHDGCQRRETVALRCGCPCHDHRKDTP